MPNCRPVGSLLDLALHDAGAQAAFLSDARRLEERVLHADVRIQTAAAGGHGVAGNKRIGGEAVFVAIMATRCFTASINFCEVGPRFVPLELAAS